MGEYGDRHSLLPGGVQVNPARFTELNGIKQVQSGILLGRRSGAYYFEPADDTLKTDLNTYTTIASPAGTSILSVQTTSGFKPTDIITVGATDYTIATNGVDDLNKTLKLTANLSTSVLINTAVNLKTPVDFDEIYLLAYDITDASQCQDAELYRHRSLVYLNYLPGYPFTSSARVLTKIKELYECQMGV